MKIEQVTVNLRWHHEKSCFAVYIIIRNRIIWNKNIKIHLLQEMFLEVNLWGFFFSPDFLIFRSTWKPKNWFSLKKNRLICYCKINNYQNKQKSSQGYQVNYVKKHYAKFQNDWSSWFWVMMYTDFKNNKFKLYFFPFLYARTCVHVRVCMYICFLDKRYLNWIHKKLF